LKATKDIPKIPDLKGIGIGQDLSKNRSKIAYLARQAVKQKQIKSTSVRDAVIPMEFLAEREELEREAALQTYHVIGVEEDSS
jgi:hypothetical protein